MPKHILQLEIELDAATPAQEVSRLAEIQGWLAKEMKDDWACDNEDEDAPPMRYDGLEAPYVTNVETKLVRREPDPEPVEDDVEDAKVLEPFTVIGYWTDGCTRRVVGVVPGEVEVTGGLEVSDGGPFAVIVHAEDDDAAEQMVEDTDDSVDFG